MKKLDNSKYMQALGLFIMARSHAERAREFQNELIGFLEADDLGNVCDAVWEDGDRIKDFDTALENEGFTVERSSR